MVASQPRRLVVWGVVLLAALAATAFGTVVFDRPGEISATSALTGTTAALRRHDGGALRRLADPELDPTFLSRSWLSAFGGFAADHDPVLTRTDSDSFVHAEVAGELDGQRTTLTVLLHRGEDGRWFANGIART